ncbi:hypothetical protein TGVAND_278540 [Toxoplasma gondii VAND]|uniref:Uncharacterized protein n=1 Tax=Toxoplasma gondii VAND TaxID=933077 RepID=A0A086Q9K4_TOXGO|nr:hypothetical protein TGVAND_278540 [Toxoplasma gondii VAND]
MAGGSPCEAVAEKPHTNRAILVFIRPCSSRLSFLYLVRCFYRSSREKGAPGRLSCLALVSATMEQPGHPGSSVAPASGRSPASRGYTTPLLPERTAFEKKGNASTVDVLAQLEDPSTRMRVVSDLRKELEAADCFWAKLGDHARETCGERLSVPVVSAFKSIHTQRLAGLNLEQVDSVCRDVLAAMVRKAESA